MDQFMSTEFMWAVVVTGAIVGIYVLVKVPELLVAVLLVGFNFIQLVFQLIGMPITRRTFGIVGAVIFLPVVLLLLVMRMVQVRERAPIIGRANIPFVVVTVVLGLFLVIGLTYSPSARYGPQKARDFFVFGMAPMFIVFIFLRDRASMHRFLMWVTLIAAVSIILTSAHNLSAKGTIFALTEIDYDIDPAVYTPPSQMALAAPLLVTMAATLTYAAARTSVGMKMLPLAFLPLISAFMLLSGKRAYLVGFALAVMVGGYYAYKGHRTLFFAGLAILLLTVLLVVLFGPPDLHERIFSSWIEPGTVHGSAGHERVLMLQGIPSKFKSAPIFGHGTGSWPILEFGLDEYAFPHNMWAEILVEDGLVGLALLLTLWCFVFHRVWRLLHSASPGTELYGFAVFGGCLLAMELANSFSNFGIAHHSCSFLITSGITLRATFLAEEEEAATAVEEGVALQAGPL